MQRPMRSKLFVPGSRPELFAKAAASAADALSFDLEDAVAADRKAEARTAVGSFLRGRSTDDRKVVVVRANGLSSGLFEDDLQVIVGPGLDVLNLPMVESGEEVREAARVLARLRGDCRGGTSHRHPGQYRDTQGFAAGGRDRDRRPARRRAPDRLRRPVRAVRHQSVGPQALSYVRMAIRLAAAEARIPAYDGAYAVVAKPERFREECEEARNLGFAGKSCIHPTQVPIANECFMPRPAEIEKARRILAAAEEAAAKGVGAFVVDGQMIDEPFLVSARAIVALAEQFDPTRTGEGR